MKQLRFSSVKKQAGDFLIESLIGLVLMAVIGMGVVYVSSRANVAQKDMRMQEIAVNQLRAMLINHRLGGLDICSGTHQITLPNNDPAQIDVDVQGCGVTLDSDINGKTVTGIPRPLALSVESDSIGGRVAIGSKWEIQ